MCSVIVVVFMELKSKLTYLGPRNTLRPPLPKTSWEVGKLRAAVFHQFRSCLGPSFGFPLTSQLSCSKSMLFTAASLVLRQETGKPVRTTLMTPICHAPYSFSWGPDHVDPQHLPLPKGSS